MITANRRVLPDVVIVGAQRAGTTSCFRYLTQHPQLVKPIRKEIHYFDRRENFAKGESWYRAHFPTSRKLDSLAREDSKRRFAIEATPEYMFVDYVPTRMAALIPDAKLICVLRNPVDRALSNWKLKGKWGGQFGPFEVEIEQEFRSLQSRTGPLDGNRPSGLLARGRYAEQLERLYEHYPRERVYVAHSESLYRDTNVFCRSVFEFLKLPPIAVDAGEIYNQSSDRLGMDPDVRARLQDYFAPHNERLFELLGRDYGWND
jgi:hypothetical protein